MIHLYSRRSSVLFRFIGWHRSESDSTIQKLRFLQNHPFSSSTSLKKSIEEASNQRLFSVSYLINSCGLTPEKAQTASKYVNFETPERPDSVIAFLQNHGFTKSQITILIRKMPPILLSDPEKTLLPKFQFFYSKGMRAPDLAKALTLSPNILKRSLEKQIIPNYNVLKTLIHSDAEYIELFKKVPDTAQTNLYNNVIPNIEVLRQYGMPESNIMLILFTQPFTILAGAEKFKMIVEKASKLGFNISKLTFVIAVQALASMSESTWKRKLEVYGKWGWSEEATLLAFVRYPWCMLISEEKIMALMEIYVNVMGWESSLVARTPHILSLSLKKRVVPRCTVFQVLRSQGLVEKDVILRSLLLTTESCFLKKFVTPYKDKVPYLLELYEEKVNISEQ